VLADGGRVEDVSGVPATPVHYLLRKKTSDQLKTRGVVLGETMVVELQAFGAPATLRHLQL
jgi:hypothetical protein